MRIWIDMTAPAHVLVFRPIIPRLREAGHEVEVTARDYAQTLELLELHRIDHTEFGRHGGAPRTGKLLFPLSRTRAVRRFRGPPRLRPALAPRAEQPPAPAPAPADPGPGNGDDT